MYAYYKEGVFMNILIVSDSYKGSLSTTEVAEQISKGILKVIKDANLKCIPMADGGEGTVDVMVDYLGGHFEYCDVVGPMGDKVKAKYGILQDGKAVIEMAAASGLPLVNDKKRNIMKASTYGTGQLIKATLDEGCRQIYIGIGGSASNDGGIGMAQALGAHFLDDNGKEVGYGGGALKSIVDIDLSELDVRLKEIKLIVMSDVTNPLCGSTGAAAVYGPQKGATQEQIELLDEGLLNLANVIKKKLNLDVTQLEGGGAAGGLGMGLVAFTGANLKSGIEAMLHVAEFDEKLKWADLVITGEGRIDGQSINGKVPTGVAKRAATLGVPVIAIVGSIGTNAEAVYEHNIDAMESCVKAPCTLEEALKNAEENLVSATERIMRSVNVGIKLSKKKI
jgi:glycerate 2-kinase